MEYKPIRILKDIQISVRSRAEAELHYPHGEVLTVPVRNASERLPGYTVIYRHPARINVPTEKEMKLCNSGFAALIPQHKELGCDDPKSELSGSRHKTSMHKRKADREIQERQKKEPLLKERVEIEAETKPEHEPELESESEEVREAKIKATDKPSEPEVKLKEKNDV